MVLRGKRDVWELSALARQGRFQAERGGDGRGAKQHGKRGADRVIDVPLGTEVREGDQLLGDITREGQKLVVARGGKGGLGNVHFATATRRAPRFAQRGEPGEQRWIDLDLKTLGHVGFVGLPNAGKSSLLAALTAAHPEIAPYPFTTLTPNLGVAVAGEVSLVLVDVPGLIEGAHRGAGLGLRFLRHVERAGLLVQVVDASLDTAWEDYQTVRRELGQYSEELPHRVRLVALNKVDLPGARERGERVRRRLANDGVEGRLVSALSGEGVAELLGAVRAWVERSGVLEEPPAAVKTYRLEAEAGGVRVEREPDGFRVHGRQVERAVAMADLESDDGVADLQRRLARLGVDRALEEAGVQPGDTVRIGAYELEWV